MASQGVVGPGCTEWFIFNHPLPFSLPRVGKLWVGASVTPPGTRLSPRLDRRRVLKALYGL